MGCECGCIYVFVFVMFVLMNEYVGFDKVWIVFDDRCVNIFGKEIVIKVCFLLFVVFECLLFEGLFNWEGLLFCLIFMWVNLVFNFGGIWCDVIFGIGN